MTTLGAGQIILLAVLAFWFLLSAAAIRSWRMKGRKGTPADDEPIEFTISERTDLLIWNGEMRGEW